MGRSAGGKVIARAMLPPAAVVMAATISKALTAPTQRVKSPLRALPGKHADAALGRPATTVSHGHHSCTGRAYPSNPSQPLPSLHASAAPPVADAVLPAMLSHLEPDAASAGAGSTTTRTAVASEQLPGDVAHTGEDTGRLDQDLAAAGSHLCPLAARIS
jgi:hypothetical protein